MRRNSPPGDCTRPRAYLAAMHASATTAGHLSKVGRVSTANFAKGQAELALLGLDAKEG